MNSLSIKMFSFNVEREIKRFNKKPFSFDENVFLTKNVLHCQHSIEMSEAWTLTIMFAPLFELFFSLLIFISRLSLFALAAVQPTNRHFKQFSYQFVEDNTTRHF